MTFSDFQLPLLICLSFLGYKLFQKLKFPASRLLGPIIVIAIFQGCGLAFSIPSPFKTLFSVVFGVYLGLRFNRDSLGKLRASLVPALLISVLYIGITLFYGELLTALTSMDQTTAFLSVIPGGVAESVVLAVSYNADLAQVSAFQLFRFLSIVMIVPLSVSLILNSRRDKTKKNPHPVEDEDSMESSTALGLPFEVERHSWIWLFVVGPMGSYCFGLIHFPAAYMLGATFFVSGTLLISKKPFQKPLPIFYDIAQIGMGAVIGVSFTRESMVTIWGLIGPIALITTMIMIMSLLLGLLFSKLFKWDFITSFMSALPGGMSAMLILAEEFNADVVTITSMQMVRLLTAVMIIPMLYKFIL